MFSKTFLISADFDDAYTETKIQRLEESITIIGSLLGYDKAKTEMIVALMKLVFSNCFFKTPLGIFRQSKGMPMGDFSSRDSLDIDLTRYIATKSKNKYIKRDYLL